MVDLSLVICTYNNARQLREALASIGAQRVGAATSFEVVVVDNNCSDDTGQVVETFAAGHRSFDTRLIREARQGLTHARQCGFTQTQSDWIAFVDDDCVLHPDWVEQTLAFARQKPRCGAIGGRVVLDYESPPAPYLNEFGWLMGRQDLGDSPKRVSWLVGAGLVLRRTAVLDSDWAQKPILEDRIGGYLVSGGDVEIGLRIAAKGWELWYLPSCRLDHRIPERRTQDPYLRRLAFGLGASDVLVKGLSWNGGQTRFTGTAIKNAAVYSFRALRRGLGAALRRRDLRPARLDATFALGNWAGVARLVGLPAAVRREILGAARSAEE
jgi:GT2 family glycosyltransferase